MTLFRKGDDEGRGGVKTAPEMRGDGVGTVRRGIGRVVVFCLALAGKAVVGGEWRDDFTDGSRIAASFNAVVVGGVVKVDHPGVLTMRISNGSFETSDAMASFFPGWSFFEMDGQDFGVIPGGLWTIDGTNAYGATADANDPGTDAGFMVSSNMMWAGPTNFRFDGGASCRVHARAYKVRYSYNYCEYAEMISMPIRGVPPYVAFWCRAADEYGTRERSEFQVWSQSPDDQTKKLELLRNGRVSDVGDPQPWNVAAFYGGKPEFAFGPGPFQTMPGVDGKMWYRYRAKFQPVDAFSNRLCLGVNSHGWEESDDATTTVWFDRVEVVDKDGHPVTANGWIVSEPITNRGSSWGVFHCGVPSLDGLENIPVAVVDPVSLQPLPGFERLTDGHDLSPLTNRVIRLKADLVVSSGGDTMRIDWWSVTYVGGAGPEPPYAVEAQSLSASSIKVAWTRSPGAVRYRLYRSETPSGMPKVLVRSLPGTNWTDEGLTPNKRYWYIVSASNAAGEGDDSLTRWNVAGAAMTRPVNPWVVADRVPGVIYSSPSFSFTNKAVVGTGGLAGYKHEFSTRESDVPTLFWDPVSPLHKEPGEGVYYLHVVSVNSNNEEGGYARYGPFCYFNEVVGPFRLSASRRDAFPDGHDSITVGPAGTLTNRLNGQVIATPKLFYIEVVEGLCFVGAGLTNNGRPAVYSTPESFSFDVSSLQAGRVKLRVWWEAQPQEATEIVLYFNPGMSLADKNGAVVYESVVDPDAGQMAEFFVNSPEDKPLTVRIYDVRERRLVRTLQARGGELTRVVYDCRTEDGRPLPNGTYGAVFLAEGMRTEVKFVVRRRR